MSYWDTLQIFILKWAQRVRKFLIRKAERVGGAGGAVAGGLLPQPSSPSLLPAPGESCERAFTLYTPNYIHPVSMLFSACSVDGLAWSKSAESKSPSQEGVRVLLDPPLCFPIWEIPRLRVPFGSLQIRDSSFWLFMETPAFLMGTSRYSTAGGFSNCGGPKMEAVTSKCRFEDNVED